MRGFPLLSCEILSDEGKTFELKRKCRGGEKFWYREESGADDSYGMEDQSHSIVQHRKAFQMLEVSKRVIAKDQYDCQGPACFLRIACLGVRRLVCLNQRCGSSRQSSIV